MGFSGADTGGKGGAQGRGHRTHELISQPAPGAVARASAGVFGPAVWQAPGHRPAGRALSRIRDPRRLSEEIRRGADRALGVDHRVLDGCPGEAVQLRHIVAVRQIVAVRLRHSCCSARAVVVRRVRALELLGQSIAGACAGLEVVPTAAGPGAVALRGARRKCRACRGPAGPARGVEGGRRW